MKKLISISGLLIVFGAWVLGAWLAGEYVLPAPWISLYDAFVLLSQPESWQQILITLVRIFTGFGIALLLGIIVGLVMGSIEELNLMLKPVILIIQGIPPLLWAIPLIVILRNSALTPALVITLICFPAIVIAISEGAKTVPHSLKQMLRIYAPGPLPRIKELILPYLKPFLVSAIKIALVLGVKASAVAEFFGANNGIGFQLQVAYQSLQVRRLFAWGIVLVCLILIINYGLEQWERWSIKNRLPARRKNARRLQTLLHASRLDQAQFRTWLNTQRQDQSLMLENIRFNYQYKAAILESLNFQLDKAELAIISGESGLGKTTMLHIMASLLKPVQGTVLAPPRLSFVFQDDRFLPWRSNLENVALPLIYHGYDKNEAIVLAAYLLAEVGLTGEALHYPDELSGGMKKRLAFARCFAASPAAILMDEPFSGLHEEARESLWQKLFELLQLHPVPTVIVTHYPEEVPETSLFKIHFYELSGQEKRLKAVELNRVG
jgi:ABC-type nitrate/sulfonate/bicarbonate transport system ATPase subunit/ABC-type nitrate/sulfonate/bicarbonate transport system permease component